MTVLCICWWLIANQVLVDEISWDITWRSVVIVYRRVSPIFKGQESQSLPRYCCIPYIFLPLFSPCSKGSTWPHWDRSSPRYPTSHFTCLPSPPQPPYAVLILYPSNLFICICNFYCFLYSIFLALSLYFPPLLLLYSIYVFFPAVLAVCIPGTPSSFTLSLSTPLSHWFYPIGCHHPY
jgi:hypothetical protein